jgi:hypothetical protein
MDIRTGKTYDTYQAARDAGVPESDIARIDRGINGEPNPRFMPAPKVKFSKGSFKPVRRRENVNG